MQHFAPSYLQSPANGKKEIEEQMCTGVWGSEPGSSSVAATNFNYSNFCQHPYKAAQKSYYQKHG